MPTVQSITDSIRALFSDTRVPQAKTRERLEELRDLIDSLLESLDFDESDDGLDEDDPLHESEPHDDLLDD